MRNGMERAGCYHSVVGVLVAVAAWVTVSCSNSGETSAADESSGGSRGKNTRGREIDGGMSLSSSSDAAPDTITSVRPADTTVDGAELDGGGAVSPTWPTFVPEETPLEVAPLVEPDPLDVKLGGSVPPIAVRLARFIWRSEPDAQTVDLANRGKLETAEAVYAEAQRLIQDERGQRGFISFFGAWAEYNRLSEQVVPADLLPVEDAATQDAAAEDAAAEDYWAAARDEYETFVQTLTSSEARLRDILLQPHQLSRAPSQFFGTDVERVGILSQPLLLALNSYEHRTSPSKRGAFIAKRLLCREVPAENHTLPAEAPQEEELRPWLSEVTEPDDCAGCHAAIDALGFGLEEFDHAGRFRATTGGSEPDATANLSALGLPPAEGAKELAVSLLHHRDVLPCVLSHWFTYALQRELVDADKPSWVQLVRGSEFYALRDVPALIAATDAFRSD